MILDIIMPEMNGYEVCSRVEKDQFFKELPIIILSSENDVKEKLDVFNPGTYTHIEKPFNLHELIPKVKALIESKKK
jgi:DNA-binding response OmpR family regulator